MRFRSPANDDKPKSADKLAHPGLSASPPAPKKPTLSPIPSPKPSSLSVEDLMAFLPNYDPSSPDAESRRMALPKRIPSDSFLAFYRAGERARNAGHSVRSEPFWNLVLYDEYQDPEVDLKDLASPEMPVSNAFFMAGGAGNPLPSWETGWRYGQLPEGGRSRNFRDDRFEPGVSLAHLDGVGDTSDGTYRLFNNGGKKVEVAGWLIIPKGSDGEPILVGAIDISQQI